MIICGIYSCKEYLRNNNVGRVFITDSVFTRLANLLRNKELEIEIVTSTQLDALVKNTNHQGIAIIGSQKSTTEDYILKHSNRILVIDGSKDPTNLGNIIRSSAVFGYSIVVQSPKSCSITPVVSKIAAGGLEHTHICYVSNTKNFLKKLDKKFMIIALAEGGEKCIFNIPCYDNVCLVVGAEDVGIRKTLLKMTDIVTRIPTNNQEFSTLNAATAAAIAMCILSNRKTI